MNKIKELKEHIEKIIKELIEKTYLEGNIHRVKIQEQIKEFKEILKNINKHHLEYEDLKELRKESTNRTFSTKDFIKEFIEDEETVFFQYINEKTTRSINNKPAKTTITLPAIICTDDIRDVRKWNIILMAVPKTKVNKLFENRYGKDN